MQTFIKLCDRLSQAGGILSGILMLAGIVLIVGEMLVRTLFSKTLYITEEYSGYLMCAMTFVAMAYTLKEKSHIRVVALHSALKGKSKVMLDVYAYTAGFLFCAVAAWATGMFVWDAIETSSRSMQISETYLAIPQFFMPLGLGVMMLQFAAELCRSILQLRSGDVKAVEAESSSLGR